MPFLQLRLLLQPPNHHHVLHRVPLSSGERESLVRDRVEVQRLLAAHDAVGGDNDGRLAVLDAARERLCAEPSEHHGVDGADAGAGEHGNGQLHHHRKVDRHSVALLDAHASQSVAELRHLLQHLGVGEGLLLAVVALPDEHHVVALPVVDVLVKSVVREVCLGAQEPLDRHRPLGKIEIDLVHRVPFFLPVQVLGHVRPEAIRVFKRPLVHFVVLIHTADVSTLHLGGRGHHLRMIRHRSQLCQTKCARAILAHKLKTDAIACNIVPSQRNTLARR
mmetsp:Transcript_23087/g.46757  ORF Transcript_23087/g.46757 Transcript_23087/m.46757 type:complete len:277 (-) Transcript_23087:199-1029(-)